MNLEDMILVIESRGKTETNYLSTLPLMIGKVEGFMQKEPETMVLMFAELGRSVKDVKWANLQMEDDTTIYMSYCKSEEQLLSFLEGKYNGEDMEATFSWEKCSEECQKKLDIYGIGKYGKKEKNISYQYERMEHEFKRGEQLHNFNGNDYIVAEVFSKRDMLLVNLRDSSFVLAHGVDLFWRQIKGDSEEPEMGIEWGHGDYYPCAPSRIDFQGMRMEYMQRLETKNNAHERQENEDYFRQMYQLEKNPKCNGSVRELLSEIMRSEYCTDDISKFRQNLNQGIYDKDSGMQVYPLNVRKEMDGVMQVRGVDREDAMEVAKNVISASEIEEPREERTSSR